jgi:filamentous hemagglutinin
MVDVGGAAWAFDNIPPRRILPSSKVPEGRPAGSVQEPKETEGLGGIVDNSDAKIEWKKGIKGQGDKWGDYVGEQNPDLLELPPNSKTFDHFNPITGEAISEKAMNTLCVGYIKYPQRIFARLKSYVDAAVDYEPRRESDLAPTKIESKTIHLAIPEYTSPTQ